MVRIALLSNPRSTGNTHLLPRIRSFCAAHPEIFHYEVEAIEQIETALRTIARVRPSVLVINGGDGTVQTTLTELYHGGHFDGAPPPVAVLPNGKTNLIALDLGARIGDPIVALERVLEIAAGPLEEHVVTRELIALSHEQDGVGDGLKPTLGMFLGGAGLAEAMLYCRTKLYPLGWPNWLSHAVTTVALVLSLFVGIRAAFLPQRAAPIKVTFLRQGALTGIYSLMIITTLRKMLIGTTLRTSSPAEAMQLMLVDHSPFALLNGIIAGRLGRLGRADVPGVHFRRGDEIRIESERSSVFLDGELFQARKGQSIVLRQTNPLPFLRLAA